MRVRCRWVHDFSRAKAQPLRLGPYTTGQSARSGDGDHLGFDDVEIPEALSLTGTIADLAAFLNSRADGAAGRGLSVTRLLLDGFALPAREPVAGLVRERDEVLVCFAAEAPAARRAAELEDRTPQKMLEDRARTPATPPRARTPATPPTAEMAAKAADLAQLSSQQSALIAKLTGEAEGHRERTAALERQVAELKQQLAAASARAALAEALPRAAPPRAGQSASSSSAPAAAPLAAVGAAAVPVPQEWRDLDGVGVLRVGDVIRYRVPLVDAWRGTTRRSGRRVATVAKLLPDAPDGPSVVLRQESGAMDCVEARQLSDLQVQRPR